ncbi:MAG: hypothetical protein IKL05_01935 [Clostridia bacterium]|nr:hypothetical protein [Clostridia bacterium]
MNGFVKLDPNIWKSELFNDFIVLKLWLYLICNASYVERDVLFNGSLHHLEKGQLMVGRKSLAEIVSAKEGKVYNSLKLLEKMGYITIKSNNKFSLITVINKNVSEDKVKSYDNKITTKRQQNNNRTTTEKQQNDTNIDSIDSIDRTDSIERVNKRTPRGRFGNVYLSDEEYEALKGEYYECDELIDNLSLKMQSTGKSYASHYATILKWAKEDGVKPRNERSFDPDEFFELAVKASMCK